MVQLIELLLGIISATNIKSAKQFEKYFCLNCFMAFKAFGFFLSLSKYNPTFSADSKMTQINIC